MGWSSICFGIEAQDWCIYILGVFSISRQLPARLGELIAFIGLGDDGLGVGSPFVCFGESEDGTGRSVRWSEGRKGIDG